MTWPPADTFRHRFLYGIAAGAGALAIVYFLLFALQSRGFLPWAMFTLALAATLVAGLGLALMQAARQAADAGADGPDVDGPDVDGPDPAGPDADGADPDGPGSGGPDPAGPGRPASRHRA